MKRAQLIGFSIAGIAGFIAFVGMQSMVKQKTIVKKEKIDTVEILVARHKLNLGDSATSATLGWKKWPKDALNASYITRQAKPTAIKDFSGSIANTTILKNDPIIKAKLVQLGKGSILSAILAKGKRAVSTEITATTAAAKLIVPNDHVDVLVTHRAKGEGKRGHITETILRNIRILAIGKDLNIEDKKKGSNGKVATLELTPSEAELLAQANAKGKISLALRSIADIHDVSRNISGVKITYVRSR